jgi:hypothetical protein
MSIINFTICQIACQSNMTKRIGQGFLLFELLIGIALGLLLQGILIRWQGLIIQTCTSTIQRMNAVRNIRSAAEQLVSRKQSIGHENMQEGELTMTYQEMAFDEALFPLLPSLVHKKPLAFKVFLVKGSWKDGQKRRELEIPVGIIDA